MIIDRRHMRERLASLLAILTHHVPRIDTGT